MAIAAQEQSGLRHKRPAIQFITPGASLGLRATGTPQIIEQLEAGLPFGALQIFQSNSGLDVSTLIGITERTRLRRKVAGKLTPEESERLLRIAQVFERAMQLFDADREAAARWLTTPRRALNGRRPLDYSRTELGAREVENLIGRIEHGIFS
jgi:putative toxin-antitoxin system antitoxin component (TIGR02293 family)